MKELTVKQNDAGQRLDRFVGKAVPLLPESLLQKYIRLKRIKLNGKGAKRETRLQLGDVLQLYINDEFFEKPREENSYLKVTLHFESERNQLPGPSHFMPSDILTKIRILFAGGESRTQKLKSNIVLSILLKGVSVLVTFLLVPATIDYVDSEVYGIWLTLWA